MERYYSDEQEAMFAEARQVHSIIWIFQFYAPNEWVQFSSSEAVLLNEFSSLPKKNHASI
jgi:hypothetical protein